MYVVAQIAGAVVGALLLAAAIPEAAQGNLGAHGLGPGVTVGGGMIAEIVLTFALVFVVSRRMKLSWLITSSST